VTTETRERLLGLLSLPLLLVLWQLVAMAAQNRLFPTPIAVGQALTDLALHGKLFADLGKTLFRAMVGFVGAMVIGTTLGMILGRVRWLDRLLSGWIIVGLNLPAIVIAIALYVWLGLTETALIAAVIVNKVPLVIVNIREGVRAFDRGYDDLATAYRMSFWRRLRLVHVPQLTPFLLAAVRSGLSLVWKIVLIFEILGSDGGVGFRIGVFFQFFDVPGILAYTAAFVAVVMTVEYLLISPFERRVTRWRPVQA
jgi:NitT/TauT family transport system permease protein